MEYDLLVHLAGEPTRVFSKDELLRQKSVLLDDLQHRVANSLQIIASIIMMKAKTVESEDMRRHLHDAAGRVRFGHRRALQCLGERPRRRVRRRLLPQRWKPSWRDAALDE